MLTAKQQLDNLADALVEDIMALSDEEILQEMIEDGLNPDEVAQHMRNLVDKVIKEKGPASDS